MDNSDKGTNEQHSNESDVRTNHNKTSSQSFARHRVRLLWSVVACLCIALLSVSGLLLSRIVSQRYEVIVEGGSTIIIDNWRGEVSSYESDSSYTILINDQSQKSLGGGELWGEFGNVGITANVYYINGVLHYDFAVNGINSRIQDAIDNGESLTFSLKTTNNVTLHSIRESFSNITYIVDSDTEQTRVGIAFRGSTQMDAVTWRSISRLGTLF